MRKAIDLYCCCGGSSLGIHNAGFDVTGVDITNDHEYPYKFIHSDVFDLDVEVFQDYDIIFASPPCQPFSIAAKKWINKGYKFSDDLVDKTRQLLLKTGKPFVIENVVGAPVRKDLVLCGEMFGLRVIRHRIFEIHGFTVLQPPHIKHKPPIRKNKSWYVQLAGHGCTSYSFKFEDWKKAIGIYHIHDKTHIVQAIPPKYSEYICKFL